jgi:predicted nucleotidyltransferase
MLSSTNIDSILSVIKTATPQKVLLFGSYAYGTPNENSDIDLLIIKNIPEEEVRNFRVHIKKLLWKKFKNSFSFDILVDSENRIKKRIEEGDLFYNEIFSKSLILYAE